VAFLLGYLVRHFLNEKFKRRIKELEEEVANLKNKITALEAHNAQLTSDLDIAVVKTIHLGNDLTITSGKLKVSDDHNVKLTADLNTSNNRIKVLDEELLTVKKHVLNLEDTGVKTAAEIKRYLAEIKDLQAKLADEPEAGGKKTNNPSK